MSKGWSNSSMAPAFDPFKSARYIRVLDKPEKLVRKVLKLCPDCSIPITKAKTVCPSCYGKRRDARNNALTLKRREARRALKGANNERGTD